MSNLSSLYEMFEFLSVLLEITVKIQINFFNGHFRNLPLIIYT